jgi:predicted Zn-dependent peptidase
MRRYYREKVLAAPRVLGIFGDIDVDAAQKLAEEYLGVGPKVAAGLTAPPASPVFAEPPDKTAQLHISGVIVQPWENKESAVFVGFKSDSIAGEPQAADLLEAMTLTSGYSYPTGYIFETLRGLGLVYDAKSQNFWGRSPAQPGMFWVYGACSPENATAVADGILLQMARLQGSDADMDMQWFERSKKMIEVSDALQNETAAALASQAMIDEINGNGFDYHASFKQRIEGLTSERIRDLARRRLRDCVITVSTSRPDLVRLKAGDRSYATFPAVDLTPKGIQHDTGGK